MVGPNVQGAATIFKRKRKGIAWKNTDLFKDPEAADRENARRETAEEASREYRSDKAPSTIKNERLLMNDWEMYMRGDLTGKRPNLCKKGEFYNVEAINKHSCGFFS